MKLYTERDQIRTVADRWANQYQNSTNEQLKLITYKLRALDLETVSVQEIIEIIGNDSWTRLVCTECGFRISHTKIVEIGEEPGYDSATVNLCLEHVKEALALIKK